jgi:thiamine kinase-like enzyme
MAFLLNQHNVVDYLLKHCYQSELTCSKVELLAAKNFNLLVTCDDNQKLLVKQERHNQEGKSIGEFFGEWQIQKLLLNFPQLNHISQFLPELLHFDNENSILVFKYLDDYRDLMDFYKKENSFPNEVAVAIGSLLATIHRDTFNFKEYQDFFSQNSNIPKIDIVNNLHQSLERIEPEIFGVIPADGLKFFALYQRYDSLGQAITELANAFTPSCLTHNDLKLNNILLHTNWEQSTNSIVRLIDWERSAWGDNAFDLGTLIGSYIQIWLGSLVISKSLSIDESLRLAINPLDKIQPSIFALTKAYLQEFPQILKHRPDFLQRVIQFAGFALIEQIQAMIQYQKSFGNTGIAMLQVAKTLLCRPEQSMPTIFGANKETLNIK